MRKLKGMTFPAQGEQKGAVKSLEAKELLNNGINVGPDSKSGMEQGKISKNTKQNNNNF